MLNVMLTANGDALGTRVLKVCGFTKRGWRRANATLGRTNPAAGGSAPSQLL
jgi:hypothetical protein